MAHDPRLAIESIAGQRPYQEDAVLAETLDDGRVLVAVADGMGGHAAGEVASALALETLVEAIRDGLHLDEAFTLANSRVYAKAKEPGKQGMGTTLVAALIERGEIQLANVGDSRAYLLSADGIRQLTDDHSFVAEAMKRGQSEEEAMATPWKDALTRSIGTEESVDVDVFGPFPVKDDTALMVCSDGLYKTLSDKQLSEIFRLSGSPRGAAQSLVSTAFETGSDDNISVVIAEYGEVPREHVGAGTIPIDYLPPDVDLDATLVESASSPEKAAEDGTLPIEKLQDTVVQDPVDPGAGSPGSKAEAGIGEAGGERSGLPKGAIAAALIVAAVLIALMVFG